MCKMYQEYFVFVRNLFKIVQDFVTKHPEFFSESILSENNFFKFLTFNV